MAGIYLHIPFCLTRCIYCDFYSTTHAHLAASYVEALCKEIAFRHDYLRKDGRIPPIETIYIGGGTPSLLSERQLEKLFDAIYKVYPVHAQAEITLEANPDDLTPDKIASISRLPVNRLSIGIQSFNDRFLRVLKRRHSGAQAFNAICQCKEKGLDNISIDLIYGLPQQTLSEWKEDLQKALSLHTKHISAYSLIYEEQTPLWHMLQAHKVKEADEELSLSMFNALIDQTQAAGFEHYEISNFALPGYHSRHNSAYWKNVPYLGCGPSAHSYDGTNRQWNIPDLKTYIDQVPLCQDSSDFENPSWVEKEVLNLQERYNDYVITSLRTVWGIDLYRLRQSFGGKLADYCLKTADPHIRAGLLQQVRKNKQAPEGLLKLTRKGLFLSDSIMSDLLYVQED